MTLTHNSVNLKKKDIMWLRFTLNFVLRDEDLELDVDALVTTEFDTCFSPSSILFLHVSQLTELFSVVEAKFFCQRCTEAARWEAMVK